MPDAKVIMHNSISLDGSFTDFEVNMVLHYQMANRYKADVHLIGSNTIEAGVDIYSGAIPPENESDYKKPNRNADLPYWVIVDTKGVTKGLLHICRSFKFCRDVIVLISGQTSGDYLNYLIERNYDHLICGNEEVDYETAFNLLGTNYGAKIILIDSGPILNKVLLSKHLVDEISLLVYPVLVGNKSVKLLSHLSIGSENINLRMLTCESLENKLALLRYEVLR